MTKLIEDIENYLNQQDYGSVITQTFLLPRNMKIALLSRISTLEARVKELEAGIKTILSDLKNRREFAYIRRWDMEVALRELLGIKKEEQT